jgi:3-hydroxy acid dehydrogenase/malonic semialdehyde reductase
MELQEEIGKAKVQGLALDVRDRGGVERAFRQLPSDFRDIDILVNNAGLALGLDPLQKANPVDLETMVDTNIKGVLHVTQAVLPGMVDRNRGTIIMMGSVAANWPYPGGGVYGGTKAFLKQFSLGLRADLHSTNIRVSVVEPGLVGGTEFSQIRFSGDMERVERLYENTTPLNERDVAEVVGWICGLPPHVNINAIEMMPLVQSFGALPVARGAHGK